MDRPERVGLVFPRSGQQLFVHLPSSWRVAQTMVQSGQQDRPVVQEKSSWASRYPFNDDSSRSK